MISAHPLLVRGSRSSSAPSASRGARVFALLVLACCGSAFGCRSAEPSGGADVRTAAGSGSEALESVAQRLLADVAWLADDARGGRRSGTPDADAAAEWIARRFDELGLQPAGGDGWFQEFDVPLDPRDGGASQLTATGGLRVQNADHLAPLFCSSGGAAEGSLAFAGYGITLDGEGRQWDSYAGLDVEGKVVLLVRGAPRLEVDDFAPVEVQDPHATDTSLVIQDAGWGNSTSLFNKVMNARRHGAVAVLVAQHPDERGEPILRFDSGSAAQASIPALMIDADLAARLYTRYETALDAIFRGERADGGAGGVGEVTARRVTVEADVHRETGRTRNVLARLPGRGAGPTVVLGAHYDHLGRGGSGSLAPREQGQIHNGADDNASGTATVLELARELAAGPTPPGDVLFALWSGEELGLLGSEYWAGHPTVPLDQLGMNFNFDMVGRAGDGVLQVLGAGTSPAFAAWMQPAGEVAGLDLRVNSSGQGVGGSDHQTFLKREIPALHFFSGVHTDYHKPSDDVERFEAEGAARVVALGLDLVARAQQEAALPFVQAEAEDEPQVGGGGWSVWFGSIPDYAFEGPGLRLSGTSAGSPAERAGFLNGDVMTSFGDIAIENIYDFVYALQAYKPGNVVRVVFERDGAVQEARVTLVPRGQE